MKVTKWTPAWRKATAPIELVEEPTPAWFVGQEYARFVVLTDGRVIWANGMNAIHGDLTRAAADAALDWPLAMVAGSLMLRHGMWWLTALEHAPWNRAKRDPETVELLLHRLTTWVDDTRWVGRILRHPQESIG